MYDAMPENVARYIVTAAREIRECLASGEHPKAAERAARTAYSWGHYLPPDEYSTTGTVTGLCERAVRFFAASPDAAAVELRRAEQRLAKLVKRAEERLALERCFS